MHPDVVIVGGGIVGCACAYFLAKAGVRVRVIERGPLGSGASKAGMSHVVTWEEPPMHLALARASQRIYERLADELPLDIEYRRTGSLAVVEQPAGLASMAAMVERLQAWGLDCRMVFASDLQSIEPRLAKDLPGGAYFPGDGMVNPLNTTRALAAAASSLGARIDTQVEVTGFECAPDGRVEAVRTSLGRIPCGAAVIAAGAWSSEVAKMAGLEVPILPRKGNLIVTAPLRDDFLRCKVILSAGYMESIQGGGGGVAVAANIQQVQNGNLLLGSSRQFAGFDRTVDAEAAGQVLRRCLRFLPDLAQVMVLRMWAGLRPYTPDLLPVIGPSSVVKGLYLATGHEGIGITEAPVTGKLIQQMITGEALEVDAAGLSPDRFMTVDGGVQ